MQFSKASLLISALAALSNAAPVEAEADAAAAGPKCVKGAYIISARGSNQPANTEGTLSIVSDNIKGRIPHSASSAVIYPAVIDQPPYYAESVKEGVQNMHDQVVAYVDKCGADSKVVLLGYSQGSNVLTDLLTGGSLSNKYLNKVKAMVGFGDPTYVANEPYDAGTATHNGRNARSNPQALLPFKAKFRSFCTANDYYCDSGTDGNVHANEVQQWNQAATDFVVSKF